MKQSLYFIIRLPLYVVICVPYEKYWCVPLNTKQQLFSSSGQVDSSFSPLKRGLSALIFSPKPPSQFHTFRPEPMAPVGLMEALDDRSLPISSLG